ncbi:hypothetical protein ASG17_11725 [Brevundimonas sp. Leaf363]|nr:hypothetical protein ASG17_11725 [Brevundimonas sp. Leaf363]
MQALIDMLVALIALLAAAVLSPLGLNLHSADQDREVHRVHECGDASSSAGFAVKSNTDC